MSTIEQLQQVGLNKYEAEAYYTLLTHKPLTGYEVGKHSQVPLSRSYEILERLVQKGLALIQPGEPPRYTAQDPQQFLQRMRSEMEETLGNLNTALTTLPRPGTEGDFWVVRGRHHILARLQALITATQSVLYLSIPAHYSAEIAPVLDLLHTRGCRLIQKSDARSENVFALRDDYEALIGTLVPHETCQATISTNEALVQVLYTVFEPYIYQHVEAVLPVHTISSDSDASPSDIPADRDWLDWEVRKQQRLLNSVWSNRVA